MPNVEHIQFNGVTFRRYPDAPDWAHRQYFSPGASDRKRGIGSLHQEIWKHAHGPIPDGSEIHHADFDPLNNDLDNLVCLTIAEHKEAHRERNRARSATPEAVAHLERIRPLAAAWHGSKEGRAWHRQHAIEQQFGHGEQRACVCEQCGNGFETTNQHGAERFCSNKCKVAWRRASGVDDEQRICAYCGTGFTVNRYAKKRCCDRTCAQRLRAQQASAGLQPDGG